MNENLTIKEIISVDNIYDLYKHKQYHNVGNLINQIHKLENGHIISTFSLIFNKDIDDDEITELNKFIIIIVELKSNDYKIYVYKDLTSTKIVKYTQVLFRRSYLLSELVLSEHCLFEKDCNMEDKLLVGISKIATDNHNEKLLNAVNKIVNKKYNFYYKVFDYTEYFS